MTDQCKIDRTNKYKHHEMKQTQRRRKREEGFSSFASSVFSIINLSPMPGPKKASVERNNVLCMEVSVEDK